MWKALGKLYSTPYYGILLAITTMTFYWAGGGGQAVEYYVRMVSFCKTHQGHMHIERKSTWKIQSKQIILAVSGQWEWERDTFTCYFIDYCTFYFYNKCVLLLKQKSKLPP